ncbi:hypothetical protein GALMADRAFT_282691 [Galerina marginata CBS 339.88]|uniref:Uncharacterized protein n=1 Tax=Galerina marginata (strain CBS 339.88) TaxID=685588 RepID=A0A067SGT6_GALM3|nr:hypothetical protein GALMADRAFT_282691 [Galerina marginata CBS 339.88]
MASRLCNNEHTGRNFEEDGMRHRPTVVVIRRLEPAEPRNWNLEVVVVVVVSDVEEAKVTMPLPISIDVAAGWRHGVGVCARTESQRRRTSGSETTVTGFRRRRIRRRTWVQGGSETEKPLSYFILREREGGGDGGGDGGFRQRGTVDGVVVVTQLWSAVIDSAAPVKRRVDEYPLPRVFSSPTLKLEGSHKAPRNRNALCTLNLLSALELARVEVQDYFRIRTFELPYAFELEYKSWQDPDSDLDSDLDSEAVRGDWDLQLQLGIHINGSRRRLGSEAQATQWEVTGKLEKFEGAGGQDRTGQNAGSERKGGTAALPFAARGVTGRGRRGKQWERDRERDKDREQTWGGIKG